MCALYHICCAVVTFLCNLIGLWHSLLVLCVATLCLFCGLFVCFICRYLMTVCSIYIYTFVDDANTHSFNLWSITVTYTPLESMLTGLQATVQVVYSVYVLHHPISLVESMQYWHSSSCQCTQPNTYLSLLFREIPQILLNNKCICPQFNLFHQVT